MRSFLGDEDQVSISNICWLCLRSFAENLYISPDGRNRQKRYNHAINDLHFSIRWIANGLMRERESSRVRTLMVLSMIVPLSVGVRKSCHRTGMNVQN